MTTASNDIPGMESTRMKDAGISNPVVMLTPPKTKVTVVRDFTLNYPELYLEVFLTGPAADRAGFPEMFVRSGCNGASKIEQADVVVFTGGSDVNPALYGELPHIRSFWDERRDEEDLEIYEKCLELGIPMIGVCRGAQFLHVANGGRLYQDVDNHNGSHSMWDTRSKRLLQKVSSVHHQMCIPNTGGGMEIVATATSVAKNKWRNSTENDEFKGSEIEAFFYRDTCCFGVQGHPEYRGYSEYTKWFLDSLNDIVVCSPDVERRGGYLRVKQSVIDQRTNSWAELAANSTVVISEENMSS